MSSQIERLKDIQRNNLREGYNNILSNDDFEWLIKQAEKVDKLQKTNTKLNHQIGAYSGKINLIANKLLDLEKQMLNA